ncbi:NAD(P)/FAD-dependent oxidoreductase [Saccharopolyspora shandongensis]|uniref:NAD(P)/FAD-dependent oxidoreductase n=1 Tax=Saccharopolyspora shandongensis TaxID=418495 RepID=UPI0033F67297
MNDPGIVVVGASLAAQRACAAARRLGYQGQLTVIGAEPHQPYDRPPLSKEFLAGRSEPPAPRLPVDDLNIRWLLGRPVAGLTLADRTVHLADGGSVPFTGLIIATGAAPNSWPGTPPPNVGTFRTLDDARSLRARLREGNRLLVVGAGFLGGELAAAARGLGSQVTLVEAQAQPLHRALGLAAGTFMAALHRRAGVDLRTGTRVAAFTGERYLTGADLVGGTWVPADSAVVALGATPNVEWLAGSGLWVEGGLVCDEHGRALLTDATPARGVVAAGDVTRWPHPWADGNGVVRGHWTHATEQAEVAARSLLFPDHPATYRPIPSFWSDVYGVKLRAVGFPGFADTVEVRESEPEAGRLDITYHRQGHLIGALVGNRMSRLAAYRARLAEELAATAPA